MARTSIGNKKRKFSCKGVYSHANISKSNCWADLHDYFLHDIFQRLTAKELFLNVSLVCLSWRTACWDVLFWKDEETLDLTRLGHIIRPFRFDHHTISFSARRRNIIISLLNPFVLYNLNHICVKTIIFPPDVEFSLTDIIHLSRRLPFIKQVVVPNAYFFELKGALYIWKRMEEISIGGIRHDMFVEMLSTGFYSNNLTTLRLSSCVSLFDKDRYDFELTSNNSSLIAKHLPQLKVLSIGNCVVLRDGVHIILRECKNLWRLSMARCQGVWLLSKKHERRIEASSKIISVKMEKKLEGTGNVIRLYIDSVERVFNSSEEVLDHLFGSI